MRASGHAVSPQGGIAVFGISLAKRKGAWSDKSEALETLRERQAL